jgi:hypothetical protein
VLWALRGGDDQSILDWGRVYYATEPYAKTRHKRQVSVERLFAVAKARHGLRRFRQRGLLPKANREALLIASGQNLKHLLSQWR